VLAAIDRGVPREELARIFSVSVPTIKRWLKRRRETGDVEAKPISGRPSVKGVALERGGSRHTSRRTTTSRLKSTARRSRKPMAVWRSRRPRSGGPSRAYREGGRSKKVPGSPRARRAGKGRLRRADRAGGPEAFGGGGRMRYAHLHDTRQGEGAQGKAGVRPRSPGTGARTRRSSPR
jgi:hypothetical protein